MGEADLKGICTSASNLRLGHTCINENHRELNPTSVVSCCARHSRGGFRTCDIRPETVEVSCVSMTSDTNPAFSPGHFWNSVQLPTDSPREDETAGNPTSLSVPMAPTACEYARLST